MKNHILKIFFLLSISFISCDDKKDIIEIYLTKNTIESYEGVPLKIAIKDSIIINQIIETYGEEIRIDTINERLIYMGHFSVEQNDLEEKPFIKDSEILGFNFEESKIHFSKSVTTKIYESIPNWRKNNHFGKQFALCHNGKIILNGYLIGSMSSYWSNTYQIFYHNYPEQERSNGIKSVEFSFYNSLKFKKSLKKDKNLYGIFKNRIIN